MKVCMPYGSEWPWLLGRRSSSFWTRRAAIRRAAGLVEMPSWDVAVTVLDSIKECYEAFVSIRFPLLYVHVSSARGDLLPRHCPHQFVSCRTGSQLVALAKHSEKTILHTRKICVSVKQAAGRKNLSAFPHAGHIQLFEAHV